MRIPFIREDSLFLPSLLNLGKERHKQEERTHTPIIHIGRPKPTPTKKRDLKKRRLRKISKASRRRNRS